MSRAKRANGRRAFTLVEMMLVLLVVVILTAIALPITLRMQQRDSVTKGATVIQQALLVAKSTALADRRPTGVRLLIQGAGTVANPFFSAQLEYVQEPGDFVEGWVWAPFFPTNTQPPPGANLLPQFDTSTGAMVMIDAGRDFWDADPYRNRVVYGPFSGTWNDAGNTPHPAQRVGFNFNGPVAVGDTIEFNGNGQLYRITELRDPTGMRPAAVILDRPLTAPILPPRSAASTAPQANYRIVRQARPLQGAEPVDLPTQVVIDFSTPGPLPTDNYNPATGQYTRGLSTLLPSNDILFSPEGRVIGANSVNDTIFLWVRDRSEGMEASQSLVAIYARTGGVAIYPVQPAGPGAVTVPGYPVPACFPGDPYYFAHVGRAKGTGL